MWRRRPYEAVAEARTESASGGAVVRRLEVDDVTSRRRGRTGCSNDPRSGKVAGARRLARAYRSNWKQTFIT